MYLFPQYLRHVLGLDYEQACLFRRFEPPIKVLPGDDIRTVCNYTSKRNSTASFGAGTHDEMCYGFLTYYPIQTFQPTLCIGWKSVQRCKRRLPSFNGEYDGCKWETFLRKTSPRLKHELDEACGPFSVYDSAKPELGHTQDALCNGTCPALVKNLSSNACLKGDLADWMSSRYNHVKDIRKFMRLCSPSGGLSVHGRLKDGHIVALALSVICISFKKIY